MDLRLERAGPAVVFHVEKGGLAVDEDTEELHDLVRALTMFDPGCSLVLDLDGLSQLDCCGIGQLLEIRRQICDRGGILSLVRVVPRHRKLLELLGLLGVVPVFARQEEAITACWSAQARGCFPQPPVESLLGARASTGAGRQPALSA